MKFLDGYIIATIITGVASLMNYIFKWNISAIILLSPVIIYTMLSVSVFIIKTITKKGVE